METRTPTPRITPLREQAGLTQLEMSQLLDVTENTFANWESGRSGMKWIVMVVNLCKIFGCSAEDLIEYTVEDRPAELTARQHKLAELHKRLNGDRPLTD